MREIQETRVQPLGLSGEDPLEKEMAPTLVVLAGESYGQRNLAGYSQQGCKESDMTEQLAYYFMKKTYKSYS